MKANQNFFRVWGGISGVQHTLPLLLTEGHVKRSLALDLLARLTSLNVAKRFGFSDRKGSIAEGMDADLALVDLHVTDKVESDQLFYRHRHSPYAGRALTGRICQTILRGQSIFQNGKIMAKPAGEFLKPRFR